MKLAAFALVTTTALWAGTWAQSVDPFGQPRKLAEAVASLEAIDLKGRSWSVSELSGKVVLIDFWATWCSPCLAEFPTQKRIRDRHHESGFEILAVSIDATSRRNFERFLRRHRLPWPQVLDGHGYEGPLARHFDIRAIPASLLIDREGRIAALNLRGQALERAVERLMNAP